MYLSFLPKRCSSLLCLFSDVSNNVFWLKNSKLSKMKIFSVRETVFMTFLHEVKALFLLRLPKFPFSLSETKPSRFPL